MRGLAVFCSVFTAIPAAAEQFLYAPLDSLSINCDFCCYLAPGAKCHGGIDYRATTPQTVRTAADGTVVKIVDGRGNTLKVPQGKQRRSYGNYAEILHVNGYRTIYAHMQIGSFLVSQGELVSTGQPLGLTDDSGWSTNPHLHFEVKDSQNQSVNPYGDPPDYVGGCGQNALWATCPPQMWDPCFEVDCNSPPPPSCVDELTLRSYVSQGMCDQGECAYQFVDVTCSYGCESGVCLGNPCANMVCDDPPLPYCVNAVILRTHTAPGSCSDGTCTYPYFETNCSEGCANGACLQNPCTGVACNNPPPAYCLNSATLRTYASQGQCVDGSCEYAVVDTSCADASACTTDQCASSTCVHLVTLDSDEDGFIADWCAGGNDCDDNNPLVHPNAQEVCNGKDDDCNDSIDESFGCCPTTPCSGGQLCCDGVCQTGQCCYPNGYCDLGWDGNEYSSLVCSSSHTCAYCTSDSQCNESDYPAGGFPRICCGGICYSGDCCSDEDCQTYWTEYVCGNQWSDHICQLP